MSRGLARASATASLVISWNSTLLIFPLPFSWDATCHAIASPSRSGSVASSTRSAALAAFFISARVFAFSLIVTYLGAKLLSTSTPNSRLGRSRKWPTVALTVYPRPRYLPIVLAFVGDSTMTSAPPFTGAASVSSVSGVGRAASVSFFFRGALFFFGFTSSLLSGTYQPLVKSLDVSTSSRVALLPTRARLRKLYDLIGHLLRSFCLSEHRRVRFCVIRITLLVQRAHLLYRVITRQNGTGSRRHRASRCHLGARFEINEIPARFCTVELARLCGPATARNDHRGLVLERGFDFLALHLAKRLLALFGENHRDRFAFFANQDAVDVDVARVQPLGHQTTDGGFAGARQSDQHQVPFHDAAPLGVRART